MAKYKFEKCTDINEWNEFVENSPQGTIFNKSVFIEATGYNCSYYFVRKGEELVGGTYIIESDTGKPIREIPFLQYKNCILFKDNTQLTHHKRITEEFKISELIINEILEIYGEYHLINSPFYKDMRPFLWYNYHSPEKGVFNNELWYTAILNIIKKSSEQIIEEFRVLRRRELTKKGEYIIEESDDITLLDYLHNLTFERQNINRSKEESDLLIRITEASLKHNFGRLLICKYRKNLASANLFLFDAKRGYYLFGANHSDFRNTGSSTKLMIDNILFTKKKELEQVDFVGANSPNRGDYKVSFNANILPYYSSSIVLK